MIFEIRFFQALCTALFLIHLPSLGDYASFCTVYSFLTSIPGFPYNLKSLSCKKYPICSVYFQFLTKCNFNEVVFMLNSEKYVILIVFFSGQKWCFFMFFGGFSKSHSEKYLSSLWSLVFKIHFIKLSWVLR